MNFLQDEYAIAAHWGAAIVNGDYSGLTTAECTKLDAFLSQAQAGRSGHWVFGGDESLDFCRDDISGLMADCEKAVWCHRAMQPISVPKFNNPADVLNYLHPADIAKVKQSPAYYGRDASGYGRKIATETMLLLSDGIWRRVYVCQISNAGTAYVVVSGQWWIIGPEAEEAIDRWKRILRL